MRVSKHKWWCLSSVLFVWLAGLPLMGQQNTGSIRGVVQDSAGGVIPGASVSLTNQAQGSAAGEVITNDEGVFILSGLYPSVYTITVELSGFKKYMQKDITLRIGDSLGLSPIVLEIGELMETVSVEANAQQLETVTSARSGVVTGAQLTDLGLQTRNFTGLLVTIPGSAPDLPTSFNGQRVDQASYAMDGVTVMDTGNNSSAAYRLNVDAISEFKVTTNSQSAEHGRSSGATISLVSKSGTRDFHGVGYLFKRGEWMNANTFRNNYDKAPKTRTRITLPGYTLGGPIYIPGVFNTQKDSLFFFLSHEWNRSRNTTTQRVLLPTAEERAGDFSRSINPFTGKAVTIKDPLTGKPFPNNVIPPERMNEWGKKILSFYPLPNYKNLAGPTYNDYREYSYLWPVFDQMYRIDYNATQNHRLFLRIIRNRTDRVSPCGFLASFNNICLTSLDDRNGHRSFTVSYTSILSTKLTNEFLYGNSHNFIPVGAPPADSPYYRSVSGLTTPLLYPTADPSQMIPNFAFGLGAGSPRTAFQGLPYTNKNPVINWSDNVSALWGNHSLKFGLFYEGALKNQSINASVNGTFDFSQDSTNPGDAGYAFANALLGNFATFTQASQYLDNKYRYRNYEWYLHDTWKLRSNFTLNLGLRFSIMPPGYEDNDRVSSFWPGTFDPKRAVLLYQPTKVGGVRMALNPVTQQTMPATFIGKIVPGVGDITNGVNQAAANGVPRGIMDTRGVQYAPRIGLAWQPWGASSKSVIRMGGGVFYERLQGNMIFTVANNPPMVRNDQIYYGNISTYASAGTVASPAAVFGMSKDGLLPRTYNYSLSFQRQMPANLLLDVGYVGSISRHLSMAIRNNAIPYGSAWLPQNQDPTLAATTDGRSALPANMYRPYIGYTGEGYNYSFGGSSNFNSLQVGLQRRADQDLQFGLNYRWGKALGTAGSFSDILYPTDLREREYGPLSIDRAHSLVVDFMYNVPDLSQHIGLLNHSFMRQILGGWQLSGIASFSTGAPGMITYVMSNATGATLNKLITGSEDLAPRPVFACDPKGIGSTIARYVDESCIAAAPRGSKGFDSGKNNVYGPGINNWDISLFKKIQYWNDHPERFIQLRLEMYNAFNHTQWSDFNRSATIDAAIGKVINTPQGTGGRWGFGALNTNRPARAMQLAAKVYF